jgi:hypothetical protein
VGGEPAVFFDQGVAEIPITATPILRETRIDTGVARSGLCRGRLVHIAVATPLTSTYTLFARENGVTAATMVREHPEARGTWRARPGCVISSSNAGESSGQMLMADTDPTTTAEQPVILCVPAGWAVATPSDADLARLHELGLSHLWLRDDGTPTEPIDHVPWLVEWATGPGRGLIVDRTVHRDRKRLGERPMLSASWQGSEVDLAALGAGGDDHLLRQASSAPVVRMGLRQALLDRQPGVLAEAAGLCRGSELVWLDDEVRGQMAASGELLLALSLLLALPGLPCLGWTGQHGSDEGPVAEWPVGLSADERAELAERIRLRRTAGLAGRRCEVLDTGPAAVLALRYELDDGTLTATHDLDARTARWQLAPASAPG